MSYEELPLVLVPAIAVNGLSKLSGLSDAYKLNLCPLLEGFPNMLFCELSAFFSAFFFLFQCQF